MLETDETYKPLRGHPQLVEEQPLKRTDMEAHFGGELTDLQPSTMDIEKGGCLAAAFISDQRKTSAYQILHDALP